MTRGSASISGYDAAAAADLTERYWRALYALAYPLLGNHADCEDAVQNTLLQAGRNWHTLRERNKAFSWLAGILLQECARIGRERARQARPLPVNRGNETPPDDTRAAELRQAIAALPAELQEVITLRYDAGWEANAIAVALGKPPHAVWNLLRDARMELRHKLDAMHSTE